YQHDGNGNVTEQTVGGATTSYRYDRDRLVAATVGGVTDNYDYDPYGRLRTVTSGDQLVEKDTYDGFDHVTQNQKLQPGAGLDKTTYVYDPLDRTVSHTDHADSGKAKTTQLNYRGLTSDVQTEQVDGKVTVSYQYGPDGQHLSQITHKDDGTEEA